MAGNYVVKLTDANFREEVLKSKTPVLVDFSAKWCQPCRRLAPTIAKLAGAYNNRVKVGKLDTDANPASASKYAISALPTILLFKRGRVAVKFQGLKHERDLRRAMEAVIQGGR